MLSSDAPVCPPHPLEAVAAAVQRRTLGGQHLGTDAQRISVEQALRGHTLAAAASIHREHAVGSLEPGKLADFIALSDDPLAVGAEDLLHIGVEQTWIGGQKVFDSATAHTKQTTL